MAEKASDIDFEMNEIEFSSVHRRKEEETGDANNSNGNGKETTSAANKKKTEEPSSGEASYQSIVENNSNSSQELIPPSNTQSETALFSSKFKQLPQRTKAVASVRSKRRLSEENSSSSKTRKINEIFGPSGPFSVSALQVPSTSSLTEGLDSLSLTQELDRNISTQDVRNVMGTQFWSQNTNEPETQDNGAQPNDVIPETQDLGAQLINQGRIEYNDVSITHLQQEMRDISKEGPVVTKTKGKPSTNRIDADINAMFDSNPEILSLQQRLNVNIYEPAKQTWRHVRTLQTKRITLEMRVKFYKILLEESMYPDWCVGFNPPQALLQTERAVEATVAFRQEQADKSIQMLNDLMKEEIDRLDLEIEAQMASLKVLYNSPAASSFDIKDATNSLATFMSRTVDMVKSDLQKKYDAISEAPHSALWREIPDSFTKPPEAIRPLRAQRNNSRAREGAQRPQQQQQQRQQQNQQGFQQRGRGSWRGAPRGRARNNPYQRGRGGRGGGRRPRSRSPTPAQGQQRRTLQQVFNLLADMFQ